jgi:tryptophan synthase alpha subunit
VAGCADAVVIGSRIVQEIADAPAEIGAPCEKLVREFRDGDRRGERAA